MRSGQGLSRTLLFFFIYNLSNRRSFFPLLSIYFLTLPGSTAQQIGIFTGIGSIVAFLFEIPSGYFADRFGHKRTLVLSKVFMIISLSSFIAARSLLSFSVGSAFMALGFAFHSGTSSAFIHNALAAAGREKEFTKIMSKMMANVSIVSAALIVLLPLFTKISLLLPFYISLLIDGIGLVAAILLRSPTEQEFPIMKRKPSTMWQVITTSARPGFYPAALFIGAIIGVLIGSGGFRSVYLIALGYPLALIGLVMGLSRVFWFFIGHYAHLLEEKVGMRGVMLADIIIFPLILLLTAFFSQPYVVGLLFSLATGYVWGRNQLITNHFLTSLIKDQRYKATMLSVKNQIALFIQFVVAIAISLVMQVSYKLGYAVLGIVLLGILAVLYRRLRQHIPRKITKTPERFEIPPSQIA